MSSRDQVYNNLYTIKVGDGNHFKYILFQYTLSDLKIYSLCINKVNNIKVKYKILENVDMIDKVIINEKEGTLHDTLLDMKYNSLPLFTGVE